MSGRGAKGRMTLSSAGNYFRMELTMRAKKGLRKHVLDLLRGGGAHVEFETAVAGFPVELRGANVTGMPHTPWRLVEHMRIAQWDILEFCRNPRHQSPLFPDGYWPAGDAPPDLTAWDRSVEAFRADLQAMHDLAADPSEQHNLLADPDARALAAAGDLRARLVEWRRGLTPGVAAVPQEALPPDVVRQMQEHGYWEAPGAASAEPPKAP